MSNPAGTICRTSIDGRLVLFRFYGPEREYYDRSWKLPDFEKIN